MKVRQITYIGMYLALFYILDYITKMIPFLDMPQGGSIGLSVIALLLASYHLGYKQGILVGLLSIFIQYLTGDVYMPSFMPFFLDYIFAFGIYGIASVFPNISVFYSGIVITGILRFISHTVSGVYYYGSSWQASVAYNGPYMLATTLVAMVMVPMIYSRIKVLKK